MVRGLTIGSTDYRGQSLQDILVDLENWIINLKELNGTFESVIRDLQKEGYWDSVDYDFKASCYDLQTYFNTAITDLQEVISGINSEIKGYHIRLLKNLGVNAHEKYEHHRKVWRQFEGKEYGESNFNKVEELYREGSDMTGDMFDLNNLAPRLEDFVGMSKKDNNTKSAVKVNNHFHSTVTGMQQNYESKEIQQTVNYGSSDSDKIEEMKIILDQFRKLLDQSTNDEKEEVIENVADLVEVIEQENPKKNRVKSFGNSVSTGMQKLLTMKSFNNMDEVATKLPKMIDNFGDLVDKL
ncbi:hypothetical protein ABRY75_16570 [Bacillus stercoris]|uniref:hypothetical protein n=1 Tax=Bacillus stercoris TaxID=2054641 RepID=UPI0010A99B36|nr:hypothetical protein C6Y43_19205 [Bacillus subtilis]BEV38779.1 hypothetical protein BSB_18520 [Bacillus stercoris]